jgi:hypothetical protein
MYHPAAALHQGSLNDTLFRDMQGVPAALLEARKLRESRPQRDEVGYSREEDGPRPSFAAAPEPAAAIEPSSAVSESVALDAQSGPTDQLGLF